MSHLVQRHLLILERNNERETIIKLLTEVQEKLYYII